MNGKKKKKNIDLVVVNIISCDIVELLLIVFFGCGKFYFIIFQPENMILNFHL